MTEKRSTDSHIMKKSDSFKIENGSATTTDSVLLVDLHMVRVYDLKRFTFARLNI